MADQSLLWINHDATNMKALPHRHRIFTHIQKNYRPWKQRQNTRSLRLSAKIPRPDKRRRKDDQGIQHTSSTQHDSAPSSCSSPSSSNSDALSLENSSSWTGPNSRSKRLQASPSTLVGKGNSDPFRAYPIDVTPEVNYLMAFYRNIVIPSIWYVKFDNRNAAALAARDWQYQTAHLQDEGTAYGIIARHGLVAANFSPELRRLALQYVNRSTKVLKHKIDENQATAGSANSIINCAAMLFNAQTLSHNLTAATAHGTFLVSLFRQQWTQGILDYRLLMFEIYNDCQFTAIFLCAPVFDVHGWLPMVFESIWGTAEQKLPPLAFRTLDQAVGSVELQTCFRGLQEQFDMSGLKDASGKLYLDDPLLTTWYISKACVFHSWMINHYLRCKQQLQRLGLEQEVKDHLYAQQYMALAALYLMRGPNFRFNPSVLGRPVYDAAIIPRTLRAVLEVSELRSIRPSRRSYTNARLWAFYVGAIPEQAENPRGANSTDQWFTSHLIQHAYRIGVLSWEMLHKILSGFLYSDTLSSQGSQWFDGMVAAYRARAT